MPGGHDPRGGYLIPSLYGRAGKESELSENGPEGLRRKLGLDQEKAVVREVRDEAEIKRLIWEWAEADVEWLDALDIVNGRKELSLAEAETGLSAWLVYRTPQVKIKVGAAKLRELIVTCMLAAGVEYRRSARTFVGVKG
jgi:hypothetical protein